MDVFYVDAKVCSYEYLSSSVVRRPTLIGEQNERTVCKNFITIRPAIATDFNKRVRRIYHLPANGVIVPMHVLLLT